MTIEEIKSEICKQVNDPQATTYGGRAIALFESAVLELVDNNKFNEAEIARIVENYEATIAAGQNEYDLDGTGHDVYRIIGVWRHPDESLPVTFTQIPYQQMGTITINDNLKPFADEVLWSTGGDKLWFHTDIEDDYKCNIRYIRPPSSNPDLENLNDVFIKKAIAVTVAKLRAEIAGE